MILGYNLFIYISISIYSLNLHYTHTKFLILLSDVYIKSNC
jgi:hypothetical protein